MKYRWIFALSIAAALALSVLVSGMEPEHNRYHQHLEAEEKPPCTDHDEFVFCTHLPLMEITTDAPVPKPYLGEIDEKIENIWDVSNSFRNYEMVAASVRYFDSETENNHLTDRPAVEARAMFRIRGASSRLLDKKNYLLKFTEEDMTQSLDVSLSGMTADSSWALHGPFLDKSLIRNYLCYNLAGEIMDYAPNVRFCELFLNGEYLGLYLLTEKIGYSENGRIDFTKTDPNLTVTSYILQVDRGAADPRYNLETFGSDCYLTRTKVRAGQGHIEILYPGKTLTQNQYDYINSDFSRFEKAIFSFDYNHPDRGYRRYIDVRSFIDFFLINEFTLNYDAPGLSTYLYKDVSGRLNMCVWDFDAAFDYYRYSEVTPETFRIHNALWFQYLFKDKAFVDQVVDRYADFRKRFFNEEYLFQYIDETVTYLGPAIQRNYAKWGYSFNSTYNGVNYDYLEPESRNVRSFDEAIQQIKDTITLRLEHMDNNLDRLYTLCHESMNKRYNHQTEAGGT
ncbi:MAG: spore coat protein CotH [Oscillibacter sp.]|nr:spore coat protein CotH [Oscillibacter sp.]